MCKADKKRLQPSLFTLSISHLSSSSPFLVLISITLHIQQFGAVPPPISREQPPSRTMNVAFLHVRRMTLNFDKFELVNLWFVLALLQRCNSGVVFTEMWRRQPAEVQSQHRRLRQSECCLVVGVSLTVSWERYEKRNNPVSGSCVSCSFRRSTTHYSRGMLKTELFFPQIWLWAKRW